MKPFNKDKRIETVDCFSDYASEIFEAFLETMQGNPDYIRPIRDWEDSEFTHTYTIKGRKLADRMRARLYEVGTAHFPNDEEYVEIYSHLFVEV